MFTRVKLVAVMMVATVLVLGGTIIARGGPASEAQTVDELIGFQLQTPVEQQTEGGATQPDPNLWVTNPYITTTPKIAWDADDQLTYQSYDRRLMSGEELTVTNRVVGDTMAHLWIIDFTGPRRDFLATIFTDPQSADNPGPIQFVANGNARVCLYGPNYDAPLENNPFLNNSPVPNSGYGGYGVINTVAATMFNIDNRHISDAKVQTRINVGFNIYFQFNCNSNWITDPGWVHFGANIGENQPGWYYKIVN